MALDVLGDPFAASAQTQLDEQTIREIAPSMPDTKVQDLIRAANNEEWDKQEGVNEKFLFDKELTSIASHISAELGPFALDAYEQSQDILSAGVLRLINEGDRTGSFRGENARGGSQWDIQQLTAQSLDDAAGPGDRVYSTTKTGDFNIAPGVEDRDPANDDASNVGNNDDGTETLDTDVQAAFVLGFYSSTNTRVVEQAKVDVDDGEERSAFDVFGHQNLGTLQAQEVPSLEYITDDDAYDINGSAVSNSNTDFFPYGMDLNTAANLPSLNTSA